VDENLLSIFHSNEAVAFLGTEPLDYTSSRHLPQNLLTRNRASP
jgi:hypothetical protein